MTNMHVLKNLFLTVVDELILDKQVDIKIGVLESAVKDLNLDTSKVDNDHIKALPYLFLKYLSNWPDWNKVTEYMKGTLDKNTWFDDFEKYIRFKMNFLLENTIPSVSISKVDSSTSTELTDDPSIADFSLNIMGPPTFLNNLVFWGNGDDIHVENHVIRPWIQLSNTQLLNYPYLEVEFSSKILCFKRCFKARVYRNISSQIETNLKRSKFILSKTSYSTVKKHPLNEVKNCLQRIMDMFNNMANSERFLELCDIIEQFCLDLLELSSETKDKVMEEHTQISFNIGKNIYQRSKKISNESSISDSSAIDVIFNEVFQPEVYLSVLHYQNSQELHNNCFDISYKCTYCKEKFNGETSKLKILNHFEIVHKKEQPLLCHSCKKVYEIEKLAKHRWSCNCLQTI